MTPFLAKVALNFPLFVLVVVRVHSATFLAAAKLSADVTGTMSIFQAIVRNNRP